MTSTSSSRVVVVGSINADLTVLVDRHPAPGETLLGAGGAFTPGGKGANQAVAAARMGASTAMVGAVGDDAGAEPATALLRSSGVDLSSVSSVAGSPTGLAVVTVSEAGENTIVVVPGANAAVDSSYVDGSAGLVSDASLCVLQGELPPETTEHAIRLASSAGVRVMLNLAPVIPLPAEVLALADPLVVNEHEAQLALEMLTGESAEAHDDPVAHASALATDLLRSGPRSVVVTLGAAGALVAQRGHEPSHLAAPQVDAIDSTGAGDAFVGALAAGLVAGEDLCSAASLAVRVGAYSVQRRGAQPSFPKREDALP